MATITKPKKFNLVAIELKGESVSVSWTDKGDEHTCSSKLPIHPDFKNGMNKLVDVLTDYYGMNGDCNDHTSFKKLSVNNYEDDEGQSAQVKGVYSHPKGGQNTTMTTAKIQTHSDAYGFEGDLKSIISDMAEEACAYVFDKKSNQTTMDLEPEVVEKEAVEA
jgi:hypothetical protein